MPRANYFPKLEKTDTSLYMLGWGGAIDRRASSSCSRCCRRYNGKGDGDYNYGRYTNAKLDELTGKIKVDMNAGGAPRTRSTRRCSRTTPRSTTFRCTGR